MKKGYILSVLIFCLLPLYLLATPLTEKYGAYAYVLSEFDIEGDYIYDDSFEKFVLKNEKKIKRFYTHARERGDTLLPLVQRHLMEDELSDLFMYISMVESGFNTEIVSPKKAVGLWQFMPLTAKEYNLSVCNSYDERCDPVISTKAAISHLKRLHKRFGKWYLAIMAYNCGEGRLAKAIRRAGSDDLATLLNSYEKYLPGETRAYIKKILLVALIGESEIIDFESRSSEFLAVDVDAGESLKELAALLEMKLSLLQKLNPQYKNASLPEKKTSYKVMIPEDKMVIFYLKYKSDTLNKEGPKQSIKPHLISHYVKLGETLESIARRYKSSSEEISAVNRLDDEALELDRLLLIPVTESMFDAMLEE